jgi:hypothetical protein
MGQRWGPISNSSNLPTFLTYRRKMGASSHFMSIWAPSLQQAPVCVLLLTGHDNSRSCFLMVVRSVMSLLLFLTYESQNCSLWESHLKVLHY